MKKHIEKIKKHSRKHLPTFHKMWHIQVDLHLFKVIFVGLLVVVSIFIILVSMTFADPNRRLSFNSRASSYPTSNDVNTWSAEYIERCGRLPTPMPGHRIVCRDNPNPEGFCKTCVQEKVTGSGDLWWERLLGTGKRVPTYSPPTPTPTPTFTPTPSVTPFLSPSLTASLSPTMVIAVEDKETQDGYEWVKCDNGANSCDEFCSTQDKTAADACAIVYDPSSQNCQDTYPDDLDYLYGYVQGDEDACYGKGDMHTQVENCDLDYNAYCCCSIE